MTYYIALEGGGTRTTAGIYTPAGELLRQTETGPCNPVAYGMDASAAALIAAARALWPEDAQAEVEALAGCAGLVDLPMRRELAMRLLEALPLTRARVTEDLQPMLYANAAERDVVLVIPGTGANVLGKAADGRTAQAGGRGTAFGDEGSAWQIGITALRAAAYAVDGLTGPTILAEALPKAAGVEKFNDLVTWAHSVTKNEIAKLTHVVSECALAGDAAASQVIQEQARKLALYVRAVVRRLELPVDTRVLLHGGLFDSPLYRAEFEEALDMYCGLSGDTPEFRGHRAVFELRHIETPPPWLADVSASDVSSDRPVGWDMSHRLDRPEDGEKMVGPVPPYEEAFLQANGEVSEALRAVQAPIAHAIALAAEAIAADGRILYIGAGTSGRLGVLDASECPPTFGVAPERVVGIIAGGEAALRHSIEGAEDDEAAGRADILAHSPTPHDLVVGIAASGTTPYTRAALEAARAAGAKTCLVCCVAGVEAPGHHVVAINTGPEIVAGSTRLKAGTATKIVLNAMSTGAFALNGYVYDGYMVGVQPKNVKLRQRAIRIVSAIAGVEESQSRALLEQAAWDVRTAVVIQRLNLDAAAAREKLEQARGHLARALGEVP